ncbi:hypothetical protein B484DRAFT_459472 [Ochromonadaceae sp. CCMP2298]|nr:hypothetical protein B484DRAFT_459472 [Ochromonadaceae sp. CCMP2298]
MSILIVYALVSATTLLSHRYCYTAATTVTTVFLYSITMYTVSKSVLPLMYTTGSSSVPTIVVVPVPTMYPLPLPL